MAQNMLFTLRLINKIQKRFAGHSKWANIRHIKALKDTQRANLFMRLSRQIKVAVQEGGSVDPKSNLKLEQTIEQAKRANMPVASIQSVLKSIQTDKNQARKYMIELKGPGSCIILCEVFTDNLHHLKQLLATVLRKHMSKFTDGGVRHLFEEKGLIETENNNLDLEIVTDHAIEAGAEDVKLYENQVQFICAPTSLNSVQDHLMKLNYKITSANVELIPLKTQSLSEEDLEICSSLYDKLEAFPEVVKLYDNIA